jgi:hypothetical protein
MMNVFMHLRKCCNHPYLFKGIESSAEMVDDASMQMLLQVRCDVHAVLLFFWHALAHCMH